MQKDNVSRGFAFKCKLQISDVAKVLQYQKACAVLANYPFAWNIICKILQKRNIYYTTALMFVVICKLTQTKVYSKDILRIINVHTNGTFFSVIKNNKQILSKPLS